MKHVLHADVEFGSDTSHIHPHSDSELLSEVRPVPLSTVSRLAPRQSRTQLRLRRVQLMQLVPAPAQAPTPAPLWSERSNPDSLGWNTSPRADQAKRRHSLGITQEEGPTSIRHGLDRQDPWGLGAGSGLGTVTDMEVISDFSW